MSARVFGRHQRVLIDTSVWIYQLEQHPRYGAVAGMVVESLEQGKFRGVASELTLLELTVRPLQMGRQDIADEYEILLGYFPNLELLPIGADVLMEAAALRAQHRLRTPDAIQLATARRAGATLAVTNDDAWRNLGFIETLVLSDLITK